MHKYLIVFVGLAMSAVAFAQEPARAKTGGAGAVAPLSVESARAELEAMLETDQGHRRELIELEKKHGRNSSEVKAVWKKQGAIDAQNIQRLEEIIAQHGWPGISQFGSKAASATFLILQHSDIRYQKKYLPLARAAAEKREMQPSSLALLEDRVRLREGKKQLYGSQVNKNAAGEWEPEPLEDEAKVDELRASVGLKPLADYLQGFADRSGGRVSPKWAKAPAAPASGDKRAP